jgi:hypothetical protein
MARERSHVGPRIEEEVVDDRGRMAAIAVLRPFENVPRLGDQADVQLAAGEAILDDVDLGEGA